MELPIIVYGIANHRVRDCQSLYILFVIANNCGRDYQYDSLDVSLYPYSVVIVIFKTNRFK